MTADGRTEWKAYVRPDGRTTRHAIGRRDAGAVVALCGFESRRTLWTATTPADVECRKCRSLAGQEVA